MTGRNLHQEWVGKTPLSAIPAKVKLRVLDAQRPAPNELPICPICGLTIRTGDGCDFDHRTPLADGGEHRENNLHAVHAKCHRMKTAVEAHERALSRAAQMGAYGLKKRQPMRSRGFAKAAPQHTATRPIVRRSERP